MRTASGPKDSIAMEHPRRLVLDFSRNSRDNILDRTYSYFALGPAWNGGPLTANFSYSSKLSHWGEHR